MLKQAMKSKTVQFGIVLACLSVIQGFVGYLPADPAIQAIVGCAIASAIVVLRFMTTMPVSEK